MTSCGRGLSASSASKEVCHTPYSRAVAAETERSWMFFQQFYEGFQHRNVDLSLSTIFFHVEMLYFSGAWKGSGLAEK
jgi:hypothetical protein